VARRHHQVPEFYLKYFVGYDPQGSRHLWVYDKTGDGNPRPQTPENTIVERGYYSFETIEGVDEQLEDLHGELEAKASPILARLRDPKASLNYTEIALLAQFLSVLHVRVPRTRNVMIEHMRIEAFETLRILSTRQDLQRRFLKDKHPKLGGHPVQEEELAAILRDPERDFRVEVDPKAALIDCFKLLSDLPQLLYRMNWIVCDAPTCSHFVTSDAPMCVYLPTGAETAIIGGGFGRPDVQISFPISPKVLLLIDWRHGKESHFRVSAGTSFVSTMNWRMAWNAERFVISSIRDPVVRTQINQAKVTASRPKLDRRSLGALISRRMEDAFDKL
jgi:hypothetical protein